MPRCAARARSAAFRRSGQERAGRRARARMHRARAGRRARRAERGPARRWRPELDLQLRPVGAASRSSRSNTRRDRRRILARREPDGHVRVRLHREHRLLQPRRAARDAVDVDARARPRCGRRTPRRRARRPAARPGRRARRRPASTCQPASSSAVGGTTPARAARAGVRRAEHGAEQRHERVHRVQRRAAVDARVEVARAGAHADVEVDESARGDVERGPPAPRACPRRRSPPRRRRARPRRGSRRSSGRRSPPRRRTRSGR